MFVLTDADPLEVVGTTFQHSEGTPLKGFNGAGREAYEDFCRRLESEIPFLRRMARRWDRQKANADDLVQDTLLQALANLHLWQPGSNLRAWMTTIMRNRFFAMVAKSARSVSPLEDSGEECPTWMSDLPEARLVLRDVERALRRLPRVQRTIIQLVAIGGKTYEEAAEELGVTVAAVRCHLMRARERLRIAVHNERLEAPFSGRAAGVALPSSIARGFFPTSIPVMSMGAD